MERYDLAVLGGGPGGNAAAKQVARRGGRVCIIEENHFGGICLNVGCIPTKAMLHGSHLCWQMRLMEPLGIGAVCPEVDGRAFMKRIADLVGDLSARADDRMREHPRIDAIFGRGRLTGLHSMEAETPEGTVQVEADALLIATGASSIRPGFMPWHSNRVLASDNAVTLDHLPESVIVVGGGVIGCEFATAYAELGVETCLVEMRDSILDLLEDPDISAIVARSLQDRGVEICTGTQVEEMTADADGLTSRLSSGRTIRTSHAVAAAGRRPNLDNIGLETAGLEPEDGILPVDEHCRTRIPHIYATGDVAEKSQYAHLAERMGKIAGDNVMGVPSRDDRRIVPSGVYTIPQVAMVGMTLGQVRRERPDFVTVEYSYENPGIGSIYQQKEGKLKIYTDSTQGRIYGVVWIAPNATDLIHEFVLAMRYDMTLEQIVNTIHAHPTYQETAYEVAEIWLNQYRMTQAEPVVLNSG